MSKQEDIKDKRIEFIEYYDGAEEQEDQVYQFSSNYQKGNTKAEIISISKPYYKYPSTTPEDLFKKANIEMDSISNNAKRLLGNTSKNEAFKEHNSTSLIREEDTNTYIDRTHVESKQINYNVPDTLITSKTEIKKSQTQEISNQNDNQSDISNEERDNFEKDFEMVKQVNKFKEENRELKKQLKLQENRITELESQLDCAIENAADLEYKINAGGNPTINDSNKQLIRANEEIKKLTLQINKLNVTIDKLKQEKLDEVSLLKEKYNDILKKSDQWIATEKKIKQDLLTKDKRIAKLLEELDKGNTKIVKKDNTNDKQINDLQNEIKLIEKQKNEVVVAFKKALKLISILKRQKAHLEQCKLLNISEEKFSQLLAEGNI